MNPSTYIRASLSLRETGRRFPVHLNPPCITKRRVSSSPWAVPGIAKTQDDAANAATASTPVPTPASVLPQPPASRPRIWPYGRGPRLPNADPSLSASIERERLKDFDMLRNDDILTQFINNHLKDGKKAESQAIISAALFAVQKRTGKDPLPIFRAAVQSVTPVMVLSKEKRGAKSIYFPRPITERQGRRRGIMWIINAAALRRETEEEERLAGEILSAFNGNSSANKQKENLHKECLQYRANAKIRL